MVEWYNFFTNQQDNGFILQPFEYWVHKVSDDGPTQADRMLIHTPMMEQAHERRFAISQDNLDMSDFEHHHCRRVTDTIVTLQTHFRKYATRQYDKLVDTHEPYLVGLNSTAAELEIREALFMSNTAHVDIDFARMSRARKRGLQDLLNPTDVTAEHRVLPISEVHNIEAARWAGLNKEGKEDDEQYLEVLDQPPRKVLVMGSVRSSKNTRQRKSGGYRIGHTDRAVKIMGQP